MSNINWNIIAIARCSAQFRTDKMTPHGLKGIHTGYLCNICAHPGITQDKLAQMIYTDKSNVARQVAFLEEHGYITRQSSSADKRCLELYPTQKSLDLLPELHAIVRQWEALIAKDLTEEEIETVTAILSKMRRSATCWTEET